MKLHTIIPGFLYQRGDFPTVDEATFRNTFGPLRIVAVVGVGGKPNPLAQRAFDWAYLWEPFPDSHNFSSDKVMDLAVRAYNIAQARRGAILVHCHAGRNRSGLISALLVVMMTQLTGREAIEVVRKGRKNALANPHFEQFLNRVVRFDPRSIKFELS